MNPKAGEIWQCDYNGKERTVVVVADHENHCTVLLLNDSMGSGRDVKITARSAMYTNPTLLAYRWYNCFIDMVKKMPDGEFADLLGAVADALCIKTDDRSDELEAKEAEIASLKDLCEEYGDRLGQLRAEADRLKIENAKLRDNGTDGVAALRAERDVYRALYEQTVDKLVSGR